MTSKIGPAWDAWCLADDVLTRAHVVGGSAGRKLWRRAYRLRRRLTLLALRELQAWEGK